jgi:hypothetical protein
LARWTNYFPQVLNVHGVNDVRQAEIHTAELLVPEPRVSEIQLAIGKIKIHKSPGIDQIPAELIKAGGREISSENHKLIIFICNKEELPEEWNPHRADPDIFVHINTVSGSEVTTIKNVYIRNDVR